MLVEEIFVTLEKRCQILVTNAYILSFFFGDWLKTAVWSILRLLFRKRFNLRSWKSARDEDENKIQKDHLELIFFIIFFNFKFKKKIFFFKKKWVNTTRTVVP